MADLFSGVIGIVVLAVLVVLAIEWFFLPFAVFGIDSKFQRMEQQQRELTRSLQAIHKQLVRLNENTLAIHNATEEK